MWMIHYLEFTVRFIKNTSGGVILVHKCSNKDILVIKTDLSNLWKV